MTLYGKCNTFETSKIAIHDGLLLLYSDKVIFEKIASDPVNGFNSKMINNLGYHEYITKMIYSSTLQ